MAERGTPMDDITLLSEALGATGTQASIHKGFPNAASDQTGMALSLDKLLIPHRTSTYLFRVRGEQWQELGIFDGDIAIVDRSLSPSTHALVVGWDDTGEFHIGHSTAAKNVWGVVTTTIHSFSARG